MPQQTFVGGSTAEENSSNNLSALLRINSYLKNSLDLRNLPALNVPPAPQTTNSSSIDSLWSELVSGGNTEGTHQRQQIQARPKTQPVAGGGLDMSSLQLSHLINGAAAASASANYAGYSAAADNSTALSAQVGCLGSGGYNFQQHLSGVKEDVGGSSAGVGASSSCGGNTPPSAGGCSSLTSPTHFPYAVSPSQPNRIISEPGSPSLDDAIMMGIQRHRQQQQQQQQQEAADKLTDMTIADLVGSLNLSSNSSSNQQRVLSNSLNAPSSGSSFTGFSSSLNSTLNNLTLPQGVDLSQLAQLQNTLNSTGNSSLWRGRGLEQHQTAAAAYNSLPYSNATGLNYNSLSSVCGNTRPNNGSVSPSTATTLDMLVAMDRNPLSFHGTQDPYSIEKAAKMHRSAAAVCEATCTWSGQLPIRIHKNPFYSCKVFLGGVPWDVTEAALRQTFLLFGNIQVEWPGKENSANPPKGYVYILFDNEKQVKNLLSACSQDFSSGGNYYYKISSRRMRQKEVQVIPWVMSDSNYVRCPSYQLDPHKTVFIGALHGMLSAEALANIINDLFGGVVYAGIDTDKHKYPIGSGRITFNNLQSYRKAVRAAFVEIKTPKFTKKVQIDPYLADSLCQMCGMQQGPYFCRDESCFKYFCRTCWLVTPHHQSASGCHKPLMRNSKLRTQSRLSVLM
uniref:Cytoplasmic polyadenylation element-binding protein 1-like n=2 Tax=Hirondellea gigas TaxID=1518452 RepID=A0A6A7FRJ1_9CRUS